MATNGIARLEDVANLANVCKSTASRILAAKPGAKLPYAVKTQDRVRHAAQRLGYKPSKLARGLTQTKTGIVGLVVPSVKDAFFPSVTTTIESVLAERGYNVILANTHGDSSTERNKIEDLLSWRVDGFIIAPSQETGDAGLFWDLWRNKVPFVLIDRLFPQTPFCSVTTDDHAGATMAVEHLLSIGRKRIARAGGPLEVSTNRFRQSGYADTLIRHGILPDPSYAIEVPPTEDGGRELFGRLVELKPRPDALFCFSDPVAAGFMEVCIAHGVRVPQDIAIVGYADLDFSNLLTIPLTTIRQPRDLLAESAAEMLLIQMDGGDCGRSRSLPVELVVRESTVRQSEEARRDGHNLINW
jgi:LacI family transcriptional regulator